MSRWRDVSPRHLYAPSDDGAREKVRKAGISLIRHWHRDPAPSTERFIENAPLTPTPKGTQLAIELIAYPEGKVQVSVSRITGTPGKRTIVQSESLMFNDINEAKDAIDGLADRVAREAGEAANE
jgi:hypothetical protein